jgi:predicted unusual protein kinase regulating ubiquinone biosynthesis (AarF/ABC1/UbiB family)
MELLLAVHGHQLFVNGYFNADPHPGNFLLLYPEGTELAAVKKGKGDWEDGRIRYYQRRIPW